MSSNVKIKGQQSRSSDWKTWFSEFQIGWSHTSSDVRQEYWKGVRMPNNVWVISHTWPESWKVRPKPLRAAKAARAANLSFHPWKFDRSRHGPPKPPISVSNLVSLTEADMGRQSRQGRHIYHSRNSVALVELSSFLANSLISKHKRTVR